MRSAVAGTSLSTTPACPSTATVHASCCPRPALRTRTPRLPAIHRHRALPLVSSVTSTTSPGHHGSSVLSGAVPAALASSSPPPLPAVRAARRSIRMSHSTSGVSQLLS